MVGETAPSTKKRALLVFADAAPLDLCRRRLPISFQALFRPLPLESGLPGSVEVHFFSSQRISPAVGGPFPVHLQKGSSFGERLENAIEDLATLGYDQIVIVGRDCPDLEARDVFEAFSLLESRRLVLGPDHRGGCYLIAFGTADRSLLKRVRWRRNSDFQELRERFGPENTTVLSIKQDLDTLADVRLLARSASRARALAEALLLRITPEFELYDFRSTNPPFEKMRLRWQLPPPSDFTLT